jgi:hypothetical protein
LFPQLIPYNIPQTKIDKIVKVSIEKQQGLFLLRHWAVCFMLDLVLTELNMPIIIRYYFCLLAIEKVLAIEADKQTWIFYFVISK